MKKLQLTKKIPEFNAYSWDGTVESYLALNNEIGGKGGRVNIDFHLNEETTWLYVTDTYGMYTPKGEGENTTNKYRVLPHEYILFGENGLQIRNEQSIKDRYDIVLEEKVYTGRLQGPVLEAWNKS